jgi:hypothetical protein
MIRAVKGAVLIGLLAGAGMLAIVAHSALSSHSHHSAHWNRALSYARAADRTKAIVPALALRGRALAELGALAQVGPDSDRSEAAMLAGLLELENAGQDRGNGQAHMEEAAALFQRAVRLDTANDDAAYDLELLLSRSKAQGKPVGDARPEKKRTGPGRPASQRAGTGY